jgi:Zn-dependent peptidase ImmA (M78 family)
VEDIIERHLEVHIGFVDFYAALGVSGVLGATYVEKRRIYVNKALLDDGFEGRLNFTFAHEAGHWVLHRHLVADCDDPELPRTQFLCRKKDAKKPIEWQADYFAACLLMPQTSVQDAFEAAFGPDPLRLINVQSKLSGPCYNEPSVCNWPWIAAAVREAGRFTNVSKQALIIRLQELGLVINETALPMNWQAVSPALAAKQPTVIEL